MNTDCIFCNIVAKEIPSHTIWEDAHHLAFLTIFPNTEGASVIIPKKHYDSYAFDLPDTVLSELVLATKKVGKLLDRTFDDVGRTAMVFEGFGVNHVHAKLFPMHGTKSDGWKEHISNNHTYFDVYEGYILTNDGERADDEKLATLASKIKNAL